MQSRVAITLCAALLAGCSSASHSAMLPGTTASSIAHHATPVYQVIYKFDGNDGGGPNATMIASNGTLYGTAEVSGDYHNGGIVFSMTPQGKEYIVHDFGYRSDGADPNASLTMLDGVLYGTTKRGGKHDAGTVFSLELNGTEQVLYSFKGGIDGKQPHSQLLYLKGIFYGTTYAGGQYDAGTAYAVTKSGSEEVLHTFGKSYLQGAQPNTGFESANGKLFSLTYGGGKYRRGTAYSLTLDGTEHVLHSFGSTHDGSHPFNAQLLPASGVYYGTTCNGGQYGKGAVFILTKTGQEQAIYSFGKKFSDPKCPTDGLVELNGVLYGTSYSGGKYQSGTIFSMSYGRAVKVVHSFGASGDGSLPATALTVLDGTLFGTTYSGGGSGNYGTVFSYQP